MGYSSCEAHITSRMKKLRPHLLQAAVNAQLRIPSLTPSHSIWSVFSILYNTEVISLSNS